MVKVTTGEGWTRQREAARAMIVEAMTFVTYDSAGLCADHLAVVRAERDELWDLLQQALGLASRVRCGCCAEVK